MKQNQGLSARRQDRVGIGRKAEWIPKKSVPAFYTLLRRSVQHVGNHDKALILIGIPATTHAALAKGEPISALQGRRILDYYNEHVRGKE